MKQIVDFIKEGKQTHYNKDTNKYETSEYNADTYSKSPLHQIYKKLANNYLNLLVKENISSAISKAINETNKILNIFSENNISGFINGQMLGRIIETKLAESMANINGFMFQQGREASSDKDIHCIGKPSKINQENLKENLFKDIDDIPDNIKDYFNDNEKNDYTSWGIELKCSQGKGITGNKSYALDTDGKKGKQAFYILINYTAPIQIPVTVNNQEEKDIKNKIDFKINDYEAHFGFIDQSDWVYGEKGNAATLKMPILKEKRLIKLPKPNKS